jgi:hypothetical protein
MKKIFVFILMASVFTITSQAQNTTSKKLTWGYKIGINGSNLRVKDAADYNWKTGLATGLFFNIKLTDKLSLQPEALYSSMGARNVINSSGSLRLNYFSLPVMAKYKIHKGFAVIAGPQMDMLIQAKTKSSSNSFTKVTDNYNESSFILTGGAEFWPVHCLGFSARYMYGLNDVVAGSGAELKNQGVQVMAAVKF